MNDHWVVTRVARRVQLVEQELFSLPEHLSTPPVFSGYVFLNLWGIVYCFVDLCPFSFGHCVVCPSSMYNLDIFNADDGYHSPN